MLYPKFSQRYLAAIVVCLILTLSALGAVFLIYLFNEGRTPLDVTGGGKHGILKTSYVFQRQPQQHQLRAEKNLKAEQLDTPLYKSGSENSVSEVPVHSVKHGTNSDMMESSDSGLDDDESESLLLRREKELQAYMSNMKFNLQHMIADVESERKQNTLSSQNNGKEFIGNVNSEDDGDDKDESDSDIGNENYELNGTPYNGKTVASSSSSSVEDDDIVKHKKENLRDNFEPIYIDDFDKVSNVLNPFSSENYLKNPPQNSTAVDINLGMNYLEESTTTKKSNRTKLHAGLNDRTLLVNKTGFPSFSSMEKTFSKVRKQHKNKLNGNHPKNYQSLSYLDTPSHKHVWRLKHLKAAENLDMLYDNSHSINTNEDDDEDDDDDSDFAAGSGSGDYESLTNNKFHFYNDAERNTNHFKRTEAKSFFKIVSSTVLTNSKKPKQNVGYRTKGLKMQSSANATAHNEILTDMPNIIADFYNLSSSNIKSKMSTNFTPFAPKKNFEPRIPATVQSAAFTKSPLPKNLRFNGNKTVNSSNNNNMILKQDAGSSNSNILNSSRNKAYMWPTATTTIFNNSNSAIAKSVQQQQPPPPPPPPPQQQQQEIVDFIKEPSIELPPTGASSAAWLETRTRRIIGNVKKSEERSRQLLLCEEAGGGELCRMLFKGHLNE